MDDRFTLDSPVLEGEGEAFKATRNACKLCAPLGASIAFKGISGCVPIIHGSQGCATYIRRYLISHYKEPIDIASSNFSEAATIFGGSDNCLLAIENVISQYKPEVVALASTCLSETIGDDMGVFISNFKKTTERKKLPHFVMASTPSYQGSHIDGFHEAVSAVVRAYAEEGLATNKINLFPGFVSTEDLRQLKEIFFHFEAEYILLPDYSETLDNPVWDTYMRIPEGGTTIEEIKGAGSAKASIELGTILNKGSLSGRVKNNGLSLSGAGYLGKKFNIKKYSTPLPIGVNLTDKYFSCISEITGKAMPEKYSRERGRLIDAYADGHKYIFGKKAVVYGEEDFVIALSAFLDEIGIAVVLAATGGESNLFEEEVKKYCPENRGAMEVRNVFDFEQIHEWCKKNETDILIGNSKGYYISRELDIPMVRVGFPVHDRLGGQRIKHLSYAGTQELFDKIVNTLIEYKQAHSPVGYSYM